MPKPVSDVEQHHHWSCCRIKWLQSGAEASMAPAWQATPHAHQTQPLSYSMQLHPAIDTDAGSIVAADGEGSFTQGHVQRLVPSTEAAQSSCQACCSVDEASSDRRSSLNQLRDGDDGVHCRHRDQSDRQTGQIERPTGQPEGQSRSGSGLSHRQPEATNRSEASILSKGSSKRPAHQLQRCGFRGGDATDYLLDGAGLSSHGVGLSHCHDSGSARPDGKSSVAGMQETQYGQADSSMSPLKVCFRVPVLGFLLCTLHQSRLCSGTYAAVELLIVKLYFDR